MYRIFPAPNSWESGSFWNGFLRFILQILSCYLNRCIRTFSDEYLSYVFGCFLEWQNWAFIFITINRHRGLRHRHSGIRQLSHHWSLPVPWLGPPIPLPVWFWHRHPFSFRYRADRMPDSLAFREVHLAFHTRLLLVLKFFCNVEIIFRWDTVQRKS